jgi:hypothetical protein
MVLCNVCIQPDGISLTGSFSNSIKAGILRGSLALSIIIECFNYPLSQGKKWGKQEERDKESVHEWIE